MSTVTNERRIRVSATDLSTGFVTLAELLKGKLPLDRALDVFAGVAPARWRAQVPTIRAHVRNGRSLVAAIDEVGIVLPKDISGVLRAAEAAGKLAQGVADAAAICLEKAEMQRALRSALAYPSFIAFAGVASLGMLLTVVIPKFETLFSEMGGELPASTRVLIGTSRGLRENASLLLLLATCSATALLWAWRTPEMRQRIDRTLLRIPGVGDMLHRSGSAMTCATLASQLAAGVPLTAAIATVTAVLSNSELCARSVRARAMILNGAGLSAAASNSGLFSETALAFARAGEASGSLAPMLQQAARADLGVVQSRVRRTVRMLEPTIIIALGAIIGLVATALLQAMYSVNTGVST